MTLYQNDQFPTHAAQIIIIFNVLMHVLYCYLPHDQVGSVTISSFQSSMVYGVL